MEFGVVIPQNELGSDLGLLNAVVDSAQESGFSHLLAYDHVLGADRQVHTELIGPYGLDDSFHEPLTLFSYLAGRCSLGFATAIVIAPQRQTALLAKQAAQVDLLSGGKFRLGLGVGWNPVEYEALAADFSSRGKRLTAQIEMLRALWTSPNVSLEGPNGERVQSAGLNPMPLQQPIPIWLGGESPAALDRIAALADGWFPMTIPGHGLEEKIETVHSQRAKLGRSGEPFGIEGQVRASMDGDKIRAQVEAWKTLGTTHLSINTLWQGEQTDHLGLISAAAEALRDYR